MQGSRAEGRGREGGRGNIFWLGLHAKQRQKKEGVTEEDEVKPEKHAAFKSPMICNIALFFSLESVFLSCQ